MEFPKAFWLIKDSFLFKSEISVSQQGEKQCSTILTFVSIYFLSGHFYSSLAQKKKTHLIFRDL